MKKVVVFGGGTGLSCLLSGLKLFPIDVTTVIAVSDNGSSTGQLKEELDIPAVGDIGKVLLSMANVDEDFVDLLRYRFHREGSSLNNHPVRNILLAALIDQKGSLTEATRYMARLLKVQGSILPLTEEKVELVGQSYGREFVGEVEVSRNVRYIRKLTYDHDIRIAGDIRQKIMEADLVVLSPGSLYTSILPHLIAPEVQEALEESRAPIMYVCNLVTQPGETDGMTVGDHVRVLNKYLGHRKVDFVVANSGNAPEEVRNRYRSRENKQLVCLDRFAVEAQDCGIIEDSLLSVDPESGSIRHDNLKTAFQIFSYLMKEKR